MKKLLLTLSLIGMSTFASANSPYDICEAIRVTTSFQDRVTTCMQIVSNNRISPNATNILVKLASLNTRETLNALNAIANKAIPFEAVPACDAILRTTSFQDRVTTCLGVIADNSYDPGAIELIARLANVNTREALNALVESKNAYYDASAVNVCSTILTTTSFQDRVTTCMKISANRSYNPAAANMCARTASSNTREALNCLSAIGTDYIPTPTPDPTPVGEQLIVNKADLTKINNRLRRAKTMMERGNTDRATRILNRLIEYVRELKQTSERY